MRATARVLPFFIVSATLYAADSVPFLPAISVRAGGASKLATKASTGSALNLTVLQTPASVGVITREQLDEKGDASLADAISRSPGISAVGHPGNGGQALSARGFTGSSSVMQLYDGKRQYGGIGIPYPLDRKRDVEGKSVSGRVDTGGGRINKKKKT